jgi:hypothetical protein
VIDINIIINRRKKWKKVERVLINEVMYDVVENMYVSNDGEVKKYPKGFELITIGSPDGYGYYKTSILVNMKGTSIRKLIHISRLVLMTFSVTYPINMEANHIDGVKSNNSYENLEWLSTGDNTRHAVRTGLRKPPHGDLSGTKKYNSTIIKNIYKLNDDGHTPEEISKILSNNNIIMTPYYVWRVINGRRWIYLFKEYYNI